MADEKQPEVEEEELGLEKEKLADLDVPAEESDDVKGGIPPTIRTCGVICVGE